MTGPQQPEQTVEEAFGLLGVGLDVDEQQLRAAYTAKIRQHPPDRDPEMFEKLRDAFELVRNPTIRAGRVLLGPDPSAPLVELLGTVKSPRRFVGPAVWIEVLKEKRP